MDRETFNKRRKLGYRDDPALVQRVTPTRIGPGLQLLLLMVVASLGFWGFAALVGELRFWSLAAGVIAVLALVVLPLVWFYRSAKAPVQKLAVEIAADLLKEKLNKNRKRRS